MATFRTATHKSILPTLITDGITRNANGRQLAEGEPSMVVLFHGP